MTPPLSDPAGREPAHKSTGADYPPRLWQSFRDRRDGAVVTVVQLNMWESRFGWLTVEVEGAGWRNPMRLDRAEFAEHFDLIYDPYTGAEVVSA